MFDELLKNNTMIGIATFPNFAALLFEPFRPLLWRNRLRLAIKDVGVISVGRLKVNEADRLAKYAKAELESITGLDADHVSAVLNKPDGWHVTVDLVELRRIPAATDVLASYEAVLGPTGLLLSYRRVRRYFRDQMVEES